jgi:hypothetical protein
VVKLGKYPYIQNTGKLGEFLDKIPKIGVPSKVTTRTLPTLGFKSTNDRPIITILKFIDFLDSSGAPNQNYKDFRDSKKACGILAAELKKAYSELFELYPNACEKDDQALKDFFAPTTEGSEQVVVSTVNTFKVLCGFADFKAVAVPKGHEGKSEGEGKKGQGEGEEKPKPPGVTLNVNIQISLPVTDDASVYDKIFKAIKDNLVSRD